jgi:hypothetical protein
MPGRSIDRRTRRRRTTLLVLLALALLTACGTSTSAAGSGQASQPAAAPSTSQPAASPQTPGLPACSRGRGTDGSTSTLAIRQHVGTFTGTYLNHAPGMPPGTALRYDVAGIIHGHRFTSTWTAGSVAIQVTGHYTPTKIVLNNPGGTFSTTVFHSAANCPAG